MKIAISGKGGVGKTTLAGVMARILSERGESVISIDADPDANLPSAIGFSKEELAKLTPLADLKDMISEKTGAVYGQMGGVFKLNPDVSDIPSKYSIVKDNIRLLSLGKDPSGGAGCFCPENTVLKTLLKHVFAKLNDHVIVDMEAGLEHLSRGTAGSVDAFIVVVEPGLRSIQTALQVKKLTTELGIRHLYAVGNKITCPQDENMIKENLPGFKILGFISFNPNIMSADRDGVSPFDRCEKVRSEVSGIIDKITKEKE